MLFPPGVSEGEPPLINVITSDETHTVIEVTTPGMWVEDVDVEGMNFQRIWHPEYLFWGDAGVVTNRADVHYVVTEFGVASLHGRSLQLRAKEMLNIAHPDFHEELERAARERNLI